MTNNSCQIVELSSTELREDGYERTDRESPFEEDGCLWANSYELVCDKTGFVIRKSGGPDSHHSNGEKTYRYRNSDNVKLYGGYVSSYDWGKEEGEFIYNRG